MRAPRPRSPSRPRLISARVRSAWSNRPESRSAVDDEDPGRARLRLASSSRSRRSRSALSSAESRLRQEMITWLPIKARLPPPTSAAACPTIAWKRVATQRRVVRPTFVPPPPPTRNISAALPRDARGCKRALPTCRREAARQHHVVDHSQVRQQLTAGRCSRRDRSEASRRAPEAWPTTCRRS